MIATASRIETLFSIVILLHSKDMTSPSYYNSAFNSMTPGSFVLFLSELLWWLPFKSTKGTSLGVHFQRGLGEEERPTLNVNRIIPPPGASDWTKRQKGEDMSWTLAFLSLLLEYRSTASMSLTLLLLCLPAHILSYNVSPQKPFSLKWLLFDIFS